MDGLIMTAQILLSLSILVGLHELGHLVAAKVFGMKVEQYSIGFPPKIFGVKYGETEYSVGAIPLGGYVKISGMIDESLDTKHLKEEPEEYEFRAKPAWQRLIVMMGGIIVNVITGIVIYIALVYTYPETYFTKEEANKYGIVVYELGEELGLKTGDRIVKVNGKDFEKFEEIRSFEVLLGDNSYYTVERNGELIDIPIPPDFIEKFSEANNRFIDIRYPFEVGEIQKNSEAERIGLKEGDKIISLAGEEVQYFHEFEEIKNEHIGENIPITFLRDGKEIKKEVFIGEDGLIGFIRVPIIDISYQTYSFWESIGIGTKKAFMAVWVNIKALGKIFKGEVSASKSISGPIGIAQIFGGTWDWARFWSITGLLSMVLAFMNFLPIPALDGGHVMFLSYELISGRKPSDKFLEVSQKVGMVLLLGLMAFIIFNDIFKLL